MNENAIVKIRVEESNNVVRYGTGYRINQTHVLTALHVLDDEDGKTCFEFHFLGCDKAAKKYILAYKNEDYDIAIITFAEGVLASLAKVTTVEITAANSTMKWDGCGYPKLASNGDDRDPEQIRGGCYNTTKSNPFFQVDCKKQAEIKKWGGISGAPLFARHNKKLIGIISSVDSAVDNTHFDVSAIWKLFNDNKFLVHFAKKDALKKIHHLSQCVIEQAKQNTFASLGNNSEQIVNHLVTKELAEMLDSLEEVKNKSSEKQVVNKFALQFLPHYFADQAVVIDEALITECEGVIDLECVNDIAAECSMASLVGRAAKIERVVGKDGTIDYLQVMTKFAVAPEAGIDQGKRDVDALTQHILSASALDTVLKQRFAPSTVDPEEAVNTTLAYYKKKKGHRYYLVVRLDKTKTDYSDKAKTLMNYKAKYPDLIIINLSRDGALESFERMNLELPLIDLLE